MDSFLLSMDENLLMGDWEIIPFISADSDWGKDEDETGIELRMWIPNNLMKFGIYINIYSEY